MLRTQVQLTDEQARWLRRVAQRQGISISEVVRQMVEKRMTAEEEMDPWERASALIGRYHSGLSDVSSRHDHYLDEAYR
jgi:hypothetical protein